MAGSCCGGSKRGHQPPAGPRCNGKVWLILSDPCGIVCVCITYFVALNTILLVNFTVLIPRANGLLSWFHLFAYNYAVSIMMISQLRCMLTEPGMACTHLDAELVASMRAEFHRLQDVHVERTRTKIKRECEAAGTLLSAKQLEKRLDKAKETMPWPMGQRRWWCAKCDTFKPRHAHHCSSCRCCVLEMDHHCPWVNNCVGWRNHKYFLLFIVHAWFTCLWSAALLIWGYASTPVMPLFRGAGSRAMLISGLRVSQALIWVLGFQLNDVALYTNMWVQLWAIFDCVVCFFLVIFTCVMVFDQWEYMAEGYGIIDKKQLMADQAAAKSSGSTREVFLPMNLDNVAVLVQEATGQWRADNSLYLASTPGLGYRRSRNLADKDDCYVRWGDVVIGVPEGDFLRCELRDASPISSRCLCARLSACCCHQSRSWSCEKLPQIMGSDLGVRWLLPVSAGPLDMAVVPEDDFIAECRARHLERASEIELPHDQVGLRRRRGLDRDSAEDTGGGVYDTREFARRPPPAIYEYDDDSESDADDGCC